MAKIEYTNEVRAAVMAALLTGQSVAEIAAQYNIPEGTVKSWKSRQKDSSVATVATPKKAEIGDLLLDYLHTMLRALRVQAEHFGDKSWLTKQTAADLAVLHGVSVDKAVRLLEALDGAPDSTE